jgi:[ribosomal protein S18]-alanine N-acetyltransferase
LIFRPAQLNDLPELLAIESASFNHPWSKDSFLSEIKKVPASLYLIRRKPSACVLGYLCFWSMADEIQMLNLAVHPDCRRQGLGRRLMTFLFLLAEEEGISKVFLEVRPSNQPAISLYRSLGFKTLYRRPGYYEPDEEDALVMEWTG